MTDKEILEAMKAMLEPIKVDLSGVKTELSGVKADLSEVKRRVTKIELTQENIIVKNIQLLAEGHHAVVEKLKVLDALEEKVDDHDTRIWALEQAARAKA